jgi:hypothetical protein
MDDLPNMIKNYINNVNTLMTLYQNKLNASDEAFFKCCENLKESKRVINELTKKNSEYKEVIRQFDESRQLTRRIDEQLTKKKKL